jgi:uncharacterized protein
LLEVLAREQSHTLWNAVDVKKIFKIVLQDSTLSKAAELFRLAATQGNVKAQIALADMYAIGSGVPRNDRAAVMWIQRAAQQGDASAENKLGVYYFSGLGVAVDESFAAAWFAKAADQGNKTAQANLASLYQSGRGVARDLKRAYTWRLLSLQGGDTQSAEITYLASAMSKSEIAEAESAASEWRVVHQKVEPVEPNFVLLH